MFSSKFTVQFSEHLFIKTPLEGCFCPQVVKSKDNSSQYRPIQAYEFKTVSLTEIFFTYKKIWEKNATSVLKVMKKITNRNSLPEMFLWKGILIIYSKFTGEHPCQSAISINLLCKFIDIALLHGCSPVNLLQFFSEHLFKRTPLDGCFWTKNTSSCLQRKER